MKERAIDFKHPLAIGDFANVFFLPSEFHAHITYRKIFFLHFFYSQTYITQRGKEEEKKNL